MARTKQTARKAVPSSVPSALQPSLRMRAGARAKIPTTWGTERSGPVPKAKARAPGAGADGRQAVVEHTRSTPYDAPGVAREVFASQELANAEVLELWGEYKAGYSLEACQLFQNPAGYYKFFMRDEEGAEDTYEAKPLEEELEWELVEEGESATAGSSTY